MKPDAPSSELDQVAATLEAMAAAVRVLEIRSREEAPALLKPAEVARRLAIGESTVYRLVQEKSLRACRVADGAIRIAEADLQKFIKTRTEVRA